MWDIIINSFSYIGINNENDIYMLLILIGVILLAALLRIILSVGYASQQGLNTLAAKGIKSKEDIGKMKVGGFTNAAKEYMVLGEQGMGHIDASRIAGRSALRFSFLFWSFESIEGFIRGLEAAFLPLGILFALIAAEQKTFVIFVAVIFLVLRLLGSILDFTVSKKKYIDTTAYLLEREVGKFYISDDASAIMSLSTQLQRVIGEQSKSINTSLTNISSGLSESVKSSMAIMTRSVQTTMEGIANYGDSLKEPISEWRGALEQSKASQEGINTALTSMNSATEGFASVVGALGNTLSSYRDSLNVNNEHITAQLAALNQATSQLNTIAESLQTRDGAFTAELESIRANQELLNNSIQQYELTLKQLTADMGNALGKIVDFHLQNAYGQITTGVNESLEKISQQNSATLKSLQGVFDNMLEQSKAEAAAIGNLREQMEMNFASLNNRENSREQIAAEVEQKSGTE